MKHATITAHDIPDAWYKTLKEIWTNGDPYQVKYGSEPSNTKKLNITIEIQHPENRPLTDEKAPCDMKYIANYTLQYLWLGMIAPGETYTYGSRLREPIDQVNAIIDRYIEETQDRQNTMVIRRPEDISKTLNNMKHEPPCLSLIDTEIYDNKLHLTCYFRSWDAYAGLPANMAGIQIFNEALVSEINRKANLKIQTGKLVFHSKNCHIYERLYPFVEELFKVGKNNRKEALNPTRESLV